MEVIAVLVALAMGHISAALAGDAFKQGRFAVAAACAFNALWLLMGAFAVLS